VAKNQSSGVLSCDVKHWYPFNCPPIDLALGGGIPSGKIIEYFGWAHGGKTTFALESAKAFQCYWEAKKVKNHKVLWIEAESALDKLRASAIGCNLKKFELEEDIETLEQLDKRLKKTCDEVAKSQDKLPVLIVLDTLAALTTQKELDDGTFGGGIGYKPRLLRQIFRQYTRVIGKLDITWIIVNQMSRSMGNTESESTGGEGLKFHASIRAHLAQTLRVKEVTAKGQELQVGYWSNIKCKKNKLTSLQTASAYFDNERGLDPIETILKYLHNFQLVETAGSWKTLQVPAIKKAKAYDLKYQNSKTVKEAIEQNPLLRDYLDYLVYEKQSSFTTLTKVRCILKLWEYEERLFGKRKTVLTEEEKTLALVHYEELNRENLKS